MSHSAAVWRCIKMHHGYISSHRLVRTACQGLFPLCSMWSDIEPCQQFRALIDGVKVINCTQHMHTDTGAHLQPSSFTIFASLFKRRRHSNRTYWPYSNRTTKASLLHTHSQWPRMCNHTTSYNLIQQMNCTFYAIQLQQQATHFCFIKGW